MASVFLSYDHEDSALAKPIVAALEKSGHTVWFDRHIHGGAQYSRKIEEALDEADAVVVLWTPRSLESPWVRDEAAEGRDRGKLVPLSAGGITPPMGFRQFQTLDLGNWKGRAKVPRVAELLEAIDSQGRQTEQRTAATLPTRKAGPGGHPRWLLPAAAIVALFLLVGGTWAWLGRSGLPVVAVSSADASPRSEATASDLYVKLGSLAQIGKGKWQLVDATTAPRKADFVFRAGGTQSGDHEAASVVLLDASDNSLLWSREFGSSGTSLPDLRQQLSLTAGRVLGCLLEAHENGGLRRDVLKVFLDGCAELSEASQDHPDKGAAAMRSVLAAQPKFIPAWGRLLYAETGVVDLARSALQQSTAAERQLRRDIEAAAKLDPDLPEVTVARAHLLPPMAYAEALALLAKAKATSPENPQVYSEESTALMKVGRMYDAIASARRAAELDPLSPTAQTQVVLTLAWGGQIDAAKEELQKAEKVWAGTGALRDAQYSFHLRYGDPDVAMRLVPDPGLALYLEARKDPSPAKVQALVAAVKQLERVPDWGGAGFAVQSLGEFHQTDDVLKWLERIPASLIAQNAYILFRPGLSSTRQDPRFMAVASRIGLVRYWRSSGNWPDFCMLPGLPYDCKAEAAKYA